MRNEGLCYEGSGSARMRQDKRRAGELGVRHDREEERLDTGER